MTEPENIAEPEGAENVSPTTEDLSASESASADTADTFQDSNESYSFAELRKPGGTDTLKTPSGVHRHSPS
jgi:hypothetical protein